MLNRQLDFVRNHPKGIYKMGFLCTLDNGKLLEEYRERFEEKLRYLHAHPEEGFIETPEEFFQRWMNGRLGKTTNLDGICEGFELQLPEVRIQKKLKGDFRVYGRVTGLVIASDFGYSGDFGDTLVFAINEVNSRKVLVYRDETGKIRDSPLAEKKLIPQMIYQLSAGQEKYPFESLNPLKSGECTWSLINIAPQEVYKTLRDIGFSW